MTIWVDPNDFDGWCVWLVGSGDWKVTRTVTALLDTGDVFLDIGANYGTIGFAVSQRVGPGGAVHLFEPQGRLQQCLSDAISTAPIQNLKLHAVALSDSDGRAALIAPDDHTGMATIAGGNHFTGRNLVVETVTMRNAGPYIADLVEGRDFGVKIDVEGAEPSIMPGIVDLPGLKFVVFEGASHGRRLWEFFSSRGFTILGLVRNPFLAGLRQVRSPEAWARYHDFVAIPGSVEIGDSTTRAVALAQQVKRRRKGGKAAEISQRSLAHCPIAPAISVDFRRPERFAGRSGETFSATLGFPAIRA